MAKTDTQRVLDSLGEVVRGLSRITGGPDDSLPLTGTQRLALYELASGGPLRLVDLAARMGITAPTASRAVDALAAHGLVERLPDPDDRRAQRIGVTEAGRTRFEERTARVAVAFEPAVKALTRAEREQLVALLARLGEHL